MTTIVTTQEELDAAIESGAEGIVIDSPPTVWLEVRGSSRVAARGYSRVMARVSSRVEARGHSRVGAWGSSTVVAWDWSHVDAQGLSYVDAWDSTTVEARGHSHVEARGSSRVLARGLSHVEAWDLSHVEARGSSRVVALGSSCIDAWEMSRVDARGSSYVKASLGVAVHRHSARAMITGGTIIDMTSIDLSDPTVWAAHHGVTAEGGTTIVYKAVSQELVAGQVHIPTIYAVGSIVEATDWDPAGRCGGGLHFSPRPAQARDYYQGDGEPRYLACEVDVADLVPLDDKCKAPRCKVLYEVDRFGDPVAAAGIEDEQETTP